MLRLSFMRQTTLKRLKRIVQNETGQMSVFIALIFQVLFVFFAMVINIGLIVHDKINLQNAVDLGAYYAAQRQAEILNEIAHINYQIRQDYKLLAWRYRVLGTLGRDASGLRLPPARTSNTPLSDTPWVEAENPSVCIANTMWSEAVRNSDRPENHCWKDYGAAIPRIPTLTIVAPFIPLVGLVAARIEELRNAQVASCGQTGPYSWLFAVQMIRAYKSAVAARKAIIQRLRSNLISEDFKDQQMQTVKQGVLQTIVNNLTESNRATFDESSFSVMNGLANSACSANDGAATLNHLNTAIMMLYTSAVEAGSCTIAQRYINDVPTSGFPPGMTPADIAQLSSFLSEPPNPQELTTEGALLSSSLGFEKNPWCMAYVGVKARTQPRKPFAPFGEAVSLEARAFAQPFGGRIGPWYGQTWTRSAPSSSGARTDLLTAPKLEGTSLSGNVNDWMPNYSRYPGDRLGLKSQLAMGAERNLIRGYERRGFNLSLNYYNDFHETPYTGDPLAWDVESQNQTQASENVKNIRRAEMIAVAPDVFDATYYSIEPQYYSNYWKLSETGQRFQGLPTLKGAPIKTPPDIGARNGVEESKAVSIVDQVGAAFSADGYDPAIREAMNWPIRNWMHLLTGWAPAGAQNFAFPNGIYGACSRTAVAKMMVPGACAQGGRTGYSVRLVSREHLMADTWNIGGAGEGPGSILNPPDIEF